MSQIGDHLLLYLCGRMGIVGLHGRKGSVLMVNDIIKRRHIDSRDFRRTLQELYTALSCCPGSLISVQQRKIGGLALSDIKQIKEIRQRLRIGSAGTAANDNGVIPGTLFGIERDLA